MTTAASGAFSISRETAWVRGQSSGQVISPETSLAARSSMRSTVSPAVRHGPSVMSVRIAGFAPVQGSDITQSRDRRFAPHPPSGPLLLAAGRRGHAAGRLVLLPVHGEKVAGRPDEGQSSKTSPAIARCRLASPPTPWPRGTRASATNEIGQQRPSGAFPKICSPSRICISLRSQR